MYSVDIDMKQLMAEGVYPEAIFLLLNTGKNHLRFVGFGNSVSKESWYSVVLKIE